MTQVQPEMISTGSVYESFNARNLSPIQVAKSFVPPPQFKALMERSHSLVVGPRGSGKTTLLKMLQLPALAAWRHDQADAFRQGLDFVGAFIPSDVSWGEQLSHFDGATLSTQVRHVLGRAAFTTHVLGAIVDSFRDACSELVRAEPTLRHLAVSVSREQEREIIGELSAAWRIAPRLPTLASMRVALKARHNEILLIAKQQAIGYERAALSSVQAIEYLHLDAVAAVNLAVAVFGVTAHCEDRKWGLLFDELEIAPKDIQRTLLRNLRSGDERVIYKLSLSPLDEFFGSDSPKGAARKHDYGFIALWYPRKEAGYGFSENLVSAMAREAFPENTPSTSELFGESEFDSSSDGSASTYSKGGRAYERFKALTARDESFRRYLARQSIDLDDLDKLGEAARAENVRRMTSIVAVRETFRGTERGLPNLPATQRSRKNPELYAGAHSIFAIAEGNPRWLIGIFRPLVEDSKARNGACPPERQSREVMAAAHTFNSLLATFPYKAGGRNVGLAALLERIGKAFYEGVVVRDFSPQPALSFIVDRKCDDELVAALGRALNAGAIVYVPEGDELVLPTVRDRRFRLSHLFGAASRLPLLLGLPIHLSTLLERGSATAGPLFDE